MGPDQRARSPLGVEAPLHRRGAVGEVDDDRDPTDLGYRLSGHDRCVAEMLVEHVEHADVLVLTGTADVDRPRLARAEAMLGLLNPRAAVLHDDDPGLAAALLKPPPAPSPAPAAPSPTRRTEVVTEAGAGVSSLVFHAHRPFHSTRLQALLETPFDGVLRGRGIAWLASRPELALRWDHGGPTLSLEPDSIWSTTGERGQALELLGIDLDAGAIHEALEAALLSDDELAAPASSWRALHEPFPAWEAEAVADLPLRDSMTEAA